MTEPLERSGPRPTSGRGRGARLRRACSHALRGALARTSLGLTRWLPLSAGQRLGAWIAALAVRIPGRARDAVLTNLGLCFPHLKDAERQRLAKESLAQGIAAMLELGPLWNWRRERVLSLVREVDGLEKLDAAVSSGRGLVLLGPHLGAWELAGLFVSARVPMTSLYRPPRVRALERCFKRARERFGARLVPADAGGVRTLFRTLQRGEAVAVLPDQDPGQDGGIFAPFFGVLTKTSTLTARLLAGTHAAAILCWAERLERGRGYRLHFLELDPGLLRCGDIERATCALNLELERLIRHFPRQYLWSYRRFRHRPPGHRNPYRKGIAACEALRTGEVVADEQASRVTPAP